MIITLLVSFAVIILCVAIICLNEDTWLILKDTLEQSAIYFDSSVFGLVSVMAIAVFFQFLYIMMTGVLGIILGYKANNLKIGRAVIYGFVLYMGLSLLALGIVYVTGLFNQDIMSIFNSMTLNSSVIKNVMLIITGVYIIYNLVIYYVGNKLLNKGVNVD